MSTRSQIAIENPDKTVSSIYCHSDGYLSYNGRILLEHYSDEKKIGKLISLGQLSSLGEKIGRKHSFDERPDGSCTFYGRDRNEKDVDAHVYQDVDTWLKEAPDNGSSDYIYLWRDGKWFWSTHPFDTLVRLLQRNIKRATTP